MGYQLTSAFGSLTFSSPVAVASAPGETNRLFVVEKAGRIYAITNLAAPSKTVFLDIRDHVNAAREGGLLGLAFHPDWAANRQFFVYYTVSTNLPSGYVFYDRVARFSIDPANPNAAQAQSEVFIISQLDQADTHQAGDLHFGPDGCLYISIGDEGPGGDGNNNSRFINKDLFGGILRIDVDKRPGGLLPNPHPAIHLDPQGQPYYLIPADNPFVGATSFDGKAINPATVRTEFWAVGFRNPWRFTFDPSNGMLLCADVGQGLWEEVNVVEPGKDYGWKYREGRHSYSGTVPGGVTLTDPVLEYPHSSGPSIPGGSAQGNSITGGVVYRGDRFSQLTGAYVFGDYGSGRIFSARFNESTGQAEDFQQLGSVTQPVAFGIDPSNGDVLVVRYGGTISRLGYSTSPPTGQPIPGLLSQTGAFSSLAALTPAPGIVPYDINLPFWSDYAIKSRWFSIPEVADTMTFSPSENWSYPAGTVWIKHFDFEFTNGVPASRKRLETRFLVKNDEGVHGFTYRWNTAQTDAVLVDEVGTEESLTVFNPNGSVLRQQTWTYPSRGACLQCHTSHGGFAIGFSTPQVNRAHDYGWGPTNQIAAWSKVGYFADPVTDVRTLPALSRPDDLSVSLERRVRSYLQANCVQCHQPGGSAKGRWDARIVTATDAAGLIDGELEELLGDLDNRVLAPGDLAHSVLLQRIATRGENQMPPLGSNIADPAGIALISQWITNSLPTRLSFPQWQIANFGSTNSPSADPALDVDGDGASNELEWLTGTDPENVASVWQISADESSGGMNVNFLQIADRGFEVQYRDALGNSSDWTILPSSGNPTGYGSTSQPVAISDPPPGSAQRYYRVRVFSQ